MKLIIAGSRSIKFLNPEWFENTLFNFKTHYREIDEVVSGKAPGVDTLGEVFAEKYLLKVAPFPADWNNLDVPGVVIKYNKFGKPYNAVAGHIRNRQMAEYADALLLIWDGKSLGSASMKSEMEKLGKPVYEVILKCPADL
jgi:hypothetical protein